MNNHSARNSYRRWLWFYPGRYRRERGAELLSTLLDAAPPDRQRPAPRDAWDLTIGGLRCRFAVPRGPAYRAAATVMALIAGVACFATAAALAAPVAVTPVAITGLLAGAVAGWLLAGSILRAFQSATGRRRAASFAVGLPSLVFNAILAISAAASTVTTTPGDWRPTAAARLFADVEPLTLLGALGLVAAAALLAWAPQVTPGTRRHDPDPWRYGSRTLTVAHLTFAGGSAVVLLSYLIRLQTVGGDRRGMTGGAYDPKDAIPFGGSALNPLLWIWAIAGLLYLLGFVLSPALLLVSVPLLMFGGKRISQRGRLLLTAAVLTAVALPLLRLTPVGDDAVNWYLD